MSIGYWLLIFGGVAFFVAGAVVIFQYRRGNHISDRCLTTVHYNAKALENFYEGFECDTDTRDKLCKFHALKGYFYQDVYNSIGSDTDVWSDRALPIIPRDFHESFETVIRELAVDRCWDVLAEALALPTADATLEFELNPNTLQWHSSGKNPIKEAAARMQFLRCLGLEFQEDLGRVFDLVVASKPPQDVGRRTKNLLLKYFAAPRNDKALDMCLDFFRDAQRRRDSRGQADILQRIAEMSEKPAAQKVLDSFEESCRGHPSKMHAFFAAQAGAWVPDVLSRVECLLEHPGFNSEDCKCLSSLLLAFVRNDCGFHQEDGCGYGFIVKMMRIVDKTSPALASRLIGAFSLWTELESNRQAQIRSQLAVLERQELEMSEITKKCVADVLDTGAISLTQHCDKSTQFSWV